MNLTSRLAALLMPVPIKKKYLELRRKLVQEESHLNSHPQPDPEQISEKSSDLKDASTTIEEFVGEAKNASTDTVTSSVNPSMIAIFAEMKKNAAEDIPEGLVMIGEKVSVMKETNVFTDIPKMSSTVALMGMKLKTLREKELFQIPAVFRIVNLLVQTLMNPMIVFYA